MYLVGLHIYYKMIHGPYNTIFMIYFPSYSKIVNSTVRTIYFSNLRLTQLFKMSVVVPEKHDNINVTDFH